MARLVWEYPLDATTLFLDVHQVRPGTVEVWSLVDEEPVLVDSHRFSSPSVSLSILMMRFSAQTTLGWLHR